MKCRISSAIIALSLTAALGAVSAYAEADRYKVVIEESYYKVKPENEEKFLELFKTRVYPFWGEMARVGVIDGNIKMYSERIHGMKPSWTFKVVVRFTNYTQIDKWLEIREEVFNRMFPGEGGYKKFGRQIMLITEEHWDQFIREMPLE
ncbi:MAG: hypothetical protein ACT4NX_06250 [Deltaproteobacteria bacterium]